MTVLVSVETVLLVLLLVLVAGLLRSHATILRRLGPEEGGERSPDPSRGLPEPPPRSRADVNAPELVGATPGGDAVKLSFQGFSAKPTLLAFLSSGCTSCAGFWETLAESRLPAGVQPLIVTHGSERERPAKIRSLAPEGVPVVMSSQAWEAYRVPSSPYFVLVDEEVRGEGVATTWQALGSLVSDAIEDQRESERASGGSRRAQSIDEKLAAAGIGPDHPSLYPGRSE